MALTARHTRQGEGEEVQNFKCVTDLPLIGLGIEKLCYAERVQNIPFITVKTILSDFSNFRHQCKNPLTLI